MTARRTSLAWASGFVLLGALLIAHKLIALDTVPPGLYVDESSIGYNAWTIAHYGVDEHGVRLPLFFEAFEDYKNPVYIYALAPLTLVFPLSPVLERLPAAIFGMLTVVLIAMTAWRLSRSRPAALFAMVLATLTPWLIQESRVGFELVSMVMLLAAGFWCLSDEDRATPRRFLAAGVFFALAIYGYSVGRLLVLLFAVAFAVAYGLRRKRKHGWTLTLVPIAAAYLLLEIWNLLNPGALTERFNLLSIGADGAPLPTLISRFAGNYIAFFDPNFLLFSGDRNIRHSTGYGGLLLAAMVPLLLLGLWTCWRRRRQSMPRLVILCLVLSPVPAALTNQGIPHALRAAPMLPVLFVLAVYGLAGLGELLHDGPVAARVTAAGGLLAATLVQAGLFSLDLYTAYPTRSAPAFDTGVEPAIQLAARHAAGHTVYLTESTDDPYIQAFFGLLPPPPPRPVTNNRTPGLRRLGVTVADPALAEAAAVPGDVLVLTRGDPMPPVPFDVLGSWDLPTNPFTAGAPSTTLVTVVQLR